jgi:hypothetical protein
LHGDCIGAVSGKLKIIFTFGLGEICLTAAETKQKVWGEEICRRYSSVAATEEVRLLQTMAHPRYFLALQQLSSILSKTLADCSVVFGDLAQAAEEEARQRPAAALAAVPAEAPRIEAAAPPPPEMPVAAPVMVAPEPTPAIVASAPEPPAPPEGPDLVPVELAARQFRISTAVIYTLFKKEKLDRHAPYGGRRPYVSRTQLEAALASTRLRRGIQVEPGQLTLIEASARMNVSQQVLCKMIAKGLFTGFIRKGRRFVIKEDAVDEFLVASGLKTPAAPKPTVETKATEAVVEIKEPPGPSIEEQLKTLLAGVGEEILQLEQYLLNMQPPLRASQIATWAGTVRKVMQDLNEVQQPGTRAEMKHLIGNFLAHLRMLADKYDVWVNALIAEWNIEDWDLYIRSLSTQEQTWSKEEWEVLEEGNLRAMILRPKEVPLDHVRSTIERCKIVLPPDNLVLARAVRMFANKLTPQEVLPLPEPVAEEKEFDVPPEVVALTRGKRVLMVGGQGERDESIERITAAFKLASLEWATHEKGKAQSLIRLQPRVTPKNFDLLLYMSRFTGHATMQILTTAKRRKVPVVMITKGYGLGSIATSIADQYSGSGPAKKATRRPTERRAHA